jgi:hypothetical protein
VRNIEYSTEDTMKDDNEQVQELEGKDFGLDTNIQQDSNKRVHPIRGSLCWLKI